MTYPTGGNCWIDCEVTDPTPLPAQLTWLNQYVQAFHNTLFTTPIGDYGKYIDVASFIDYLIVNELTANLDAYTRSAFYHKDRDGKLKAGPLWDYNFALGVGFSNTIDPKTQFNYNGYRTVNRWFNSLMTDPAFVTMLKTRWKALRQNLLSDAMIDQRITTLAAPLQAAAVARDYAKWPVSKVLMPGMAGGFTVVGPQDATFDGQVKALRTFLAARLAWIDTQWQ
jgi:hypothetical protein